MEYISFHCPKCQQLLKIPADKAGRKAKCNKCGNPLVIPVESETLAIKEVVPKATAAKKKPTDDDDDEGPATYGMAADPVAAAPSPKPKKKDEDDEDEDEDEDEAEKPVKKEKRLYEDRDEDDEDEEEEKKEEFLPRRRKKKGLRRAPLNPEQWGRVRAGLVVVAVSICIGVAGLVLVRGIVLAGLLAKPSYALVADQVFPQQIQPVGDGTNQPPNIDLARFFAGLLMGSGNVGIARTLMIVAVALLLAQGFVALVGYILFIQVPPRFGTRGLGIALTSLGLVNLILLLVFRLLPVLGVIPYVLVPVYAMELPMLAANIGRMDPIHVLWMHIPMLETFCALLVLVLAGFEVILCCAYLRAVARSLRDDEMEVRAIGLMRLGMGTLFIFFAYQMCALAGTSEVLVMLLRVLYWMGTGFLLGYLAWFVTVLFQVRALIAKKLKEG